MTDYQLKELNTLALTDRKKLTAKEAKRLDYLMDLWQEEEEEKGYQRWLNYQKSLI